MSASPIEMPHVLPLSVVASGPSAALALKALAVMDANAARVREVAVRLLAEHAVGLPELLAVRTRATQRQVDLELQPRTNADSVEWARVLGVVLETAEVDTGEGWWRVSAGGAVMVDGVRVYVGSCEMFSPTEWAAREASGVTR